MTRRSVLAALAFASCAKKSASLRVGVTPVPAGEVMAEVKQVLEQKGVAIEIVSFTDYIQPNLALASGDIDANLYQNLPFLKQFNQDRGTDFVSVKPVYSPPMGIYSKSIKALGELKQGASIALPNDPVNLGRGLILLAEAKLIALKPSATDRSPTEEDIQTNERGLLLRPLEAAQLPRVLPDVDAAVINANYALDSGLHPLRDAVYYEKDLSRYANILACRKGKEKDPRILLVAEALTSPEMKSFLKRRYQGAVIPAF
ncbi:MetQ/NlpA family ABC transporter substrate-binding protein [Bryobacter aggregatus]|uniref:MetQ/NlpA family ABC transporter substrate-binding protein n=1 Tax=Bryobacter aggregatus TaxID=360054 RepID=UPI0004E14668|nr:MetQ/NlpA family ABC transporter substrate-binding protein [Bryobacter aggregatus]